MNKSVHLRDIGYSFSKNYFPPSDIFNLRCNIFLIKEGFLSLSSYIYIFLPTADLHPSSFFRSKTSNTYIRLKKNRNFSLSRKQKFNLTAAMIRSDEV